MTSRNIPAGMTTDIAQPHVTFFHLIELQFTSGTIYLTTAPHDVSWNSITWLTIYGVGTLGDIGESGDTVEGISFTLSHANATNLGNALNEDVQGRPIIIRVATLSGTTLSVDTAAWTGKLDTMVINDQGAAGGGSVTVTAENDLIDLDMPRMVRMSDAEHTRLYPADRFFEYAASQAEVTIVWPSKEFFQI